MPAISEMLRFWVDMTLECNRRDHTASYSSGDQRGPFMSARSMGLALAAMHDADVVAANDAARTQLLPKATPPAGLPGSVRVVAAAAACLQVLLLRFPQQAKALDLSWSEWLARFALGGVGSSSEVAGRLFGHTVNSLGATDWRYRMDKDYVGPDTPYLHRPPASEPNQKLHGADWTHADHLLATRVANFTEPPGRAAPSITHFVADFDKVADKGAAKGGSRSPDEEIIGIYWAYDGPMELGTPPRLYMQVVLAILDSLHRHPTGGLDPSDELQIIAAITIAMSDAGNDAWHYKYAATHMMWRPAVGIPNAVAGSGVAIPDWLPLGRPDTNGERVWLTPNFPAYPSGHATFGAAAFQLLRLYLVSKLPAGFKFTPDGTDDIGFEFVSDEYDGRNRDPRTKAPRPYLIRSFKSLWDAIIENSVSRVYLGVHWQFDGVTKRNSAGNGDEFGIPATPSQLGHTVGVWLGTQIANQIALGLGITQATIDQSAGVNSGAAAAA